MSKKFFFHFYKEICHIKMEKTSLVYGSITAKAGSALSQGQDSLGIEAN